MLDLVSKNKNALAQMNELKWRILTKMLMPFIDKPLPPPTPQESRLCDDLREKFRRQTLVKKSGLLPSEAAWIGYMNNLRELVLSRDPREFLRWGPVTLMMAPTRVHSFSDELHYLKHLDNWSTRWKAALKESPIGHPVPFLLHPRSSGNLIRHVYHLAKFEEKTGLRVNDMSCVFEFGGGYGSMCRLFHNLGFRGNYVIYDLPLFALLQEFYLNSLGIEVQSVDRFNHSNAGVVCISGFDELKSILTNAHRQKGMMFVANESFSEIPVDQRAKFSSLISDFDAFLISYSHVYRETDNIEFFGKWKENFGNQIVWYEWRMEHMPGYSYLMGKGSPKE